jgi:hypothetical protein
MSVLSTTSESSYSFKDSITQSISNVDVKNIDMSVIFKSPLTVKSITYDFIANTLGDIKIYYTLDETTWNVFNYFIFNVNSLENLDLSDDELHIIESLDKKILKLDSIYTNPIYTFFEPSNLSVMQFSTTELNCIYDFFNIKTLQQYMISGYVVDGYVKKSLPLDNIYYSLTNIFQYMTDDILNDIYENVKIKGIKVQIRNCEISDGYPYILDTLNVLSDVKLNMSDDFYYPSIFYKNMFRPKYFETNDFIPNITHMFLEMLEYDIKEPKGKVTYDDGGNIYFNDGSIV